MTRPTPDRGAQNPRRPSGTPSGRPVPGRAQRGPQRPAQQTASRPGKRPATRLATQLATRPAAPVVRRARLGHPGRRMGMMFVGVIVVFTVFAAQLINLQGFQSAALAAQARDSRSVQDALIPATRGKIVSSDGVVLASTLERVAVVADPQAVCVYTFKGRTECKEEERPAAVAAAAKALAPLLGRTQSELTSMLSRSGRYVILSRTVTPADWQRIRDLKIPGISKDVVEAVPLRSYPIAAASGSLVGWLSGGQQPIGGLEAMADDALSGTPGRASYEQAADGSVIPLGDQSITPARPGSDVTTTINANLQWYAGTILAKQVAKTGALGGTVVVMDARNADVLAVASAPTFDPNRVTSVKGTLDDPAFSAVFEPGSTAKVMTFATALDRGTVKPDTPVIIPNRLHRQGTAFRDSHDHPTEYRTVAGALAESSNIGTILLSETLKPKTIEASFRNFGVGSVSGANFPRESAGLFPAAEEWNGSQRYTVVYGQGVSLTAIQATSVFQTIANGGVRMEPRLIASITTPDGVTVPADPTASRRVVSAEAAAQVVAMLESAASDQGTAPQAQIAGYRVAGKTGTADRVDPRTGKYSGKTASFIGFAPADQPRFVVGVFLDRPVKGYFGGTVAAPVFHDVMQYILRVEAVPPTGTKAPALPLTLPAPPSTTEGLVLRDGARPVAR